MCVDLHLHSIYSDGTDTPETLIRLALQNDLVAVALADHDTTAGIDEFLLAGHQAGITAFPAIEISAVHQENSVHILGYGIDHHHHGLQSRLESIQKGRETRNEKILEKLRGMGIILDKEELKQFSPCGQTGRPHIAALLIQKGLVRTMPQAFKRYLGQGAPAWAGRFAFSAAETISAIHEAGGLAVLAHPGLIVQGRSRLEQLIETLLPPGLDGLEAYYPGHPPKLQKQLLAIAGQHGLLVTGGSDFHGRNKPGSALANKDRGFCPPDTIMTELAHALTRGWRRETGISTGPPTPEKATDHAYDTSC